MPPDDTQDNQALRDVGVLLRDRLGLSVPWVVAVRLENGQIVTVSSLPPGEVADFLENVLLLAVAARDAGGVVH